jgi:flagellar FliL protein
MARAPATTAESDAAAPAAASAKKKGAMLPMILVGLVAAGGAGGGMFFLNKSADHGSAREEGGSSHESASGSEHGGEHGDEHRSGSGAAQYLPIAPAIVVNLNDNVTMRYLSVDMELMARDNAAIEDAKLHMPRIRNTLMMLFTQQKYDDIVDRQGKETLQKQALAAVQAVLKEETGKPQIDGLYFTNFVMQ